MMEKRGVIEPGRTPPEDTSEKKAEAEKDLEEHLTRRLADAARGKGEKDAPRPGRA